MQPRKSCTVQGYWVLRRSEFSMSGSGRLLEVLYLYQTRSPHGGRPCQVSTVEILDLKWWRNPSSFSTGGCAYQSTVPVFLQRAKQVSWSSVKCEMTMLLCPKGPERNDPLAAEMRNGAGIGGTCTVNTCLSLMKQFGPSVLAMWLKLLN